MSAHKVRVLVAVDFGGLDEASVRRYQRTLEQRLREEARRQLDAMAFQWPGQETYDLSVGSTREEA